MSKKFLKDPWSHLFATVLVCSAVSLVVHGNWDWLTAKPQLPSGPSASVPSLPPPPAPVIPPPDVLGGSPSVPAPGVPVVDDGSNSPLPSSDPFPPPSPAQIVARGPGFTPSATSSTKGKWIVDAALKPGSDARTINEALVNAKDGDTIIIRPGLYKEFLDISKSVRIMGLKQNGKETIIESDKGHTILVREGRVFLEKLVLRQTLPFSEEGTNPDLNALRVMGGRTEAFQIKAVARDTAAVIVAGGELQLEDAILTGKHGVHVAWGKLFCVRCTASGSTRSGFLVAWETDERVAMFKHCKGFSNGNAGLFVHNSKVKVESSEFFKNNTYGITTAKDGFVDVVDSKVYANNLSGVYAYEKGLVGLTRVEVYDNGENGLYIWKNSSAVVKHSAFYGNSVGVVLTDDSTLIAANSVFYKNKQLGMQLESQGEVADSKVQDNGKEGILVGEKGDIKIKNALVQGNWKGLVTLSGSKTDILGGDFSKNRQGNYDILLGSAVTSQGNTPMISEPPPLPPPPPKRMPALKGGRP